MHKATELIRILQDLIEKHGDKYVFIDVGTYEDVAASFDGIKFAKNVKRYRSSIKERQEYVTAFLIG